jgi:hypothetical membrane protein
MHKIGNRKTERMITVAGFLGLLAVVSFCIALIIFAGLDPEFSYMDDYVSKLGAEGQINAIWWNLTGFLWVGIVLIGFGIAYGKIVKDRLAGLLLGLFGLGFAFTSLPIDVGDPNAPVSKAHVVAICLALAAWLLGLARMSYNPSLDKAIRLRANIAAVLLVSSMFAFVFGVISMPVAHRLVFSVVFGWTAFTSVDLLINKKLKKGIR